MKKSVAFLFATALSLVACSDGTDETVSPDPTTTMQSEEPTTSEDPSSDETTSPDETTEPTEEETSADESSEPAIDLSDFTIDPMTTDGFPNLDGQYVMTALDIGHHDGFDRVVIRYEGEGTLNFHAEYTDYPAHDGSGLPPDIDGPVFLQIDASGLTYPETPVAALTQEFQSDYGSIRVEATQPFEGMHDIFIGLDAVRPYHASVYENPTRLVIDLAEPEA